MSLGPLTGRRVKGSLTEQDDAVRFSSSVQQDVDIVDSVNSDSSQQSGDAELVQTWGAAIYMITTNTTSTEINISSSGQQKRKTLRLLDGSRAEERRGAPR